MIKNKGKLSYLLCESKSFGKPFISKKQQKQQKKMRGTCKGERTKRQIFASLNLHCDFFFFKKNVTDYLQQQCRAMEMNEHTVKRVFLQSISITYRRSYSACLGGSLILKLLKLSANVMFGPSAPLLCVRNMCISSHITLIPQQIEDDTLLSPLWIIISCWQQANNKKIICKSYLNGCHFCMLTTTSATSLYTWGFNDAFLKIYTYTYIITHYSPPPYNRKNTNWVQ